MFPRARFLYIHRHPIEVFRSAVHMADTYYWYTFLQAPTYRGTTDFIMEQFELLHQRYVAERSKVKPERLHELSFDSLEADPIEALRRIYSKFG